MWFGDGWMAIPFDLELDLQELLFAREVELSPVGPFYDPQTQPEEALVAAIYKIDGGAQFSDPVPDVGGDVPDGAVS